jgi:hypothetical protein
MLGPQRGYEAAARTKFRDPQRRDDALWVAELVREDPAGGVRRDWLETYFCLTSPGPQWPPPRFRSALFYAYGLRWICFIGFTYVVDPGPGLPLAERRRTDDDRPPARPAAAGVTGIFDISATETAITSGAPAKAHKVR